MSIYIKVNNTEYPAEISGNNADITWDRRCTKSIRLSMSADESTSGWASGSSGSEHVRGGLRT